MKALDVLSMATFVGALLLLPFALYSFFSFGGNRYVWALAFASLILAFMGISSIGQKIAHDEIIAKLNSLGQDYRVSVNGATVEGGGKEIVAALKTLNWIPAHHSNPTKLIKIDISSPTMTIPLSLARDSNNPQEYWVFYTKYRITTSNEIGRVKTPVLAGY